MIDWGIIAILAIGILIGALVANANFRRKFFVGFRKFLAGVGTGQKGQNKGKVEEERNIKRRYVRTVKLVRCERCQGTGQIPGKVPGIVDERFAGWIDCPDCGATGEVEE